MKRFGVFALLLCMAYAVLPALVGEAASDVDGTWRVESWVGRDGGASYSIDPGNVTPNPFPIIIEEAAGSYSIEFNNGLGVQYEYQSTTGELEGRIGGLVKISDREYQGEIEDSTIEIVLSGDSSTLEISTRWDYGDGFNGDDVMTLKRVTSQQPEDPENPQEPGEPEDPQQPGEPEEPQEPENPNNPQVPDESNGGGGCSTLGLGFGILVLVGMLALRKKGGKR